MTNMQLCGCGSYENIQVVAQVITNSFVVVGVCENCWVVAEVMTNSFVVVKAMKTAW